jgi:hypothetical protein
MSASDICEIHVHVRDLGKTALITEKTDTWRLITGE